MTADAVGGVWTYCAELAAAMPEHEVHLVVMGPAPERVAGPYASVTCLDVPLEWEPDPWEGVDRAGELLLGLEADLAPDVVHLNGYVHATLPWRAPVVVVAHSDVVSWWRAVHQAEPPPEHDEYRRRVAAGLRAADAVVAPTAAVAEDLRVSYALDSATVVRNGRTDLFGERTATEPLVLASGRVWDEAKGLDRLARVAGALPVPVQVAGDGTVPGLLCLGRLAPADLHARMATAAVYAAPARYEPFGLGVLEAGLAGCALVLGDLPSLREVWGEAATYVRSDDELVDALTALVTDPAAAGAAARARALQLTPQRMADGYRAVYARLRVRAA